MLSYQLGTGLIPCETENGLRREQFHHKCGAEAPVLPGMGRKRRLLPVLAI
jgi:hypothetical protein